MTSLLDRFDINIIPGKGVDTVVGIDGREYSWYGIGSALLSFPVYLFNKLLSVNPAGPEFALSPFYSAATNVLVFLFARKLGYSTRASVLVTLFYGFATIAFYYAKDTGDHAIETFFLLLSFYFMYRYTLDWKISFIAYAAFSLGVCFITRPNALIAVPALFILLFFERSSKFYSKVNIIPLARDVAIFCTALSPFIALYMGYNYYRFGSVFETGYSLIASRLGVDFFSGTSLFNGLSGFLYSPGKGFFYYSPPAILILFSLVPFYKQHPRLAVSFVTLICSYFLFFSKNLFWHGDWAWGPRYLVATLPFFMIPAALLFEKPTRRIRYLLYPVFAIGLAVQILAVSVHPGKYFFDLILQNTRFSVSEGVGAPSIVGPPKETYYDWHRSPIVSQLKSFSDFTSNVWSYRYVVPDSGSTQTELIKSQPCMGTFDFWWNYSYIVQKSSAGFIAAFALFIIAARSGRNLYNLVLRCKIDSGQSR